MKLDDKWTSDSLAALGVEAASLLCRGDIATMASKFGYALSFGRDIESAIRSDLSHCLSELGAVSRVDAPHQPVPEVSEFEPNGSNLVAAVACLAPTNNGSAVLVELVVTSSGRESHVTLEDLSPASEPGHRFGSDGEPIRASAHGRRTTG
jgi:hypothetical protein